MARELISFYSHTRVLNCLPNCVDAQLAELQEVLDTCLRLIYVTRRVRLTSHPVATVTKMLDVVLEIAALAAAKILTLHPPG